MKTAQKLKRTTWLLLGPGIIAGHLGLQLPVAARCETGPPVITVNGVPITADQVEAEFRWIFYPKKIFHILGQERQDAFRRDAVDRVIVWELVRQKLAAAGRAITDREVEASVLDDRLRIGEGFAKYLGTFGQDEASYFWRKRNILNFQKYRNEDIAPRQQVSEQEIKEIYEKDRAYRSPEKYRVELLQVCLQNPASRLLHKTMADVAAFARKMILEGASFEEAAAKVRGNQVATRLGGGFLYEVGRGPIYEPAVVKLQPGEVGEILKMTENNYLILRLLERIPSKELTLEEARPEILRTLQQAKAENDMSSIEALKAEAKIVALDPKYPLSEPAKPAEPAK